MSKLGWCFAIGMMLLPSEPASAQGDRSFRAPPKPAKARQGKIGGIAYKVTPTKIIGQDLSGSEGGYVLTAVGPDGKAVRRQKLAYKERRVREDPSSVSYDWSKTQVASDGTRNAWSRAGTRAAGNPAAQRRNARILKRAIQAAEQADSALWPDGKARLDVK